MTAITLTGIDAIEYAENNGLTLNKYADPVEDARSGVTADEAREIAAEDPSLIWLEKEVIGQKNSIDSGRESATRYYVYIGSGCNEWIDYDNLSDAVSENPDEWVFDRETCEAVPETRNA